MASRTEGVFLALCLAVAGCPASVLPPPARALPGSAVAPPSATSTVAATPAVVEEPVECAGARCVVGVVTMETRRSLESQPDFRDLRLDLRAGAGMPAVRSLPLLPWLGRLTVHDLDAVDDLGPLSFLVALKSLSLVDLPRVRTLAPLRMLTHLENLDLLGLPGVTDPDVSALAPLRSLRRLAFEVPPAMVDLRALATLPALEVLSLSGRVSDVSWLSTAPSLRTVILGAGVPAGASQALKTLRPSLEVRTPAALDPDGGAR